MSPTGSVSSSTTAWRPRRISNGKQVLVVSCGHGGGASYLVRTLHPASYTGLDFNAYGIAFCRRRHKLPALDSVHGDAESLPFADQSFDAVINVEASHAYPRFSRFLAEVVRVLPPGGRFLYADFRDRTDFSHWETALVNTQMRQVSERVINAEVLGALEKNSQRSLDLIGRLLPALLRRFGRWFASVPGTSTYRDFQSGQTGIGCCFTKN
jgi:ubiquinone/menaquinone biosynthesis C-methylase UbiE